MSLLFVENELRFGVNDTESMFKDMSIKSSATSGTASNEKPLGLPNRDRKISTNSPYAPKIPSNLVKTTIPSFSSSLPPNSEVIIYDRQQLIEFLSQREQTLLSTQAEYETQFENFFKLAKRFHIEKLNNLKLTFKNQILKQQIYFETELLEISKECYRDYEFVKSGAKPAPGLNSKTNRRQSSKLTIDKYEQEKRLVKLFKTDMKKLLDYMRESLINSSDTLIEAYETCQALKNLEQIQNNLQRQNTQMRLMTNTLIKNNKTSTNEDEESRSDESEESSNSCNDESDDSDSENAKILRKQLSDEQLQFNKYKKDMDDLMHILDEIELQHLQRKDQLNSKIKFFNKLKNKFKFIETKYDVLNKQIASLKYESYVYKQLLDEKDRSIYNGLNDVNCAKNEGCECYQCCPKSLSASSSSRSSSTSSLSDCMADGNQLAETEPHPNQELTELNNNDYVEETVFGTVNSNNAHVKANCRPISRHNQLSPFLPYLSLSDYNRKLSLINDLINLHKSKMSTKELWTMSSSSNLNSIKYLPNYTFYNEDLGLPGDFFLSSFNANHIQASSLDLTDCSTDGDRVIVENCNLKYDRDISNWYVTRQIENMSISKFKLPTGSVIKSGKALKLETPFACSQLDFLIAIKHQIYSKKINNYVHFDFKRFDFKKIGLKIKTKLISPDGTLKAMHTQEIPQFYKEIFKYASLIKFL